MKNAPKSNCCFANIIVNDTVNNDFRTKYYYCTRCNRACDVIEMPDINEINARLESLEKIITEFKQHYPILQGY